MDRIEGKLSGAQKLVSIGGGTGHFTWLRGATRNNHPECNTAIFATWDSGGSSGRLRVEQGVLPPGDYMQCLLGMMEYEDQLDEAITILRDRSDGDPLVNLIASRAEKRHHGVEGGIDGLRRLFRIRGKIIPVSLTDLDLIAKTKTGQIIALEHNIDHIRHDLSFKDRDEITRIYFTNLAEPNPKAIEQIEDADKIIIPPGSPFTSIIPHLLVGDGKESVAKAILRSKAMLVVVSNLMTTLGEDHHMQRFSRWLAAFQLYLGDQEYIQKNQRSRIDYLIANTNHIDPEILSLYKDERQTPVEIDENECLSIAPKLKIIYDDLVKYDPVSHLLRHSPDKLAQVILSLI